MIFNGVFYLFIYFVGGGWGRGSIILVLTFYLVDVSVSMLKNLVSVWWSALWGMVWGPYFILNQLYCIIVSSLLSLTVF